MTRLIEPEINRIKFYAKQEEEFLIIEMFRNDGIFIIEKELYNRWKEAHSSIRMSFQDLPKETICSNKIATVEEVQNIFNKTKNNNSDEDHYND